MTSPRLIVLALLVVSFVFTGAAWLFTMLVHAKVTRSTALPNTTVWNLWSQVARAYSIVCPHGRLLFWRSLFQTLGVCSFIAMMIALVVGAIMSKPAPRP
jgi:hypothetical protein